MHLPFDHVRYSRHVSNVKCGLYQINKNNRAYATHGFESGPKMFADRTEAVLDGRGPGPGPRPVLMLLIFGLLSWFITLVNWISEAENEQFIA